MNPFRSRKKALDGDDTDVPAVPSHSRTFKRGKKSVPEPKPPAVDLATALPPSDDFRISLLMPNLSARFSMLREQDDPTSKIGKANDDSVLFPKRASRLNLFQRNELNDIAEVASMHGSIRPPFAAKAGSYGSSDGYGTDDGQVMSRSRPGEGNTLFGGRQKIYRIPVATRRSLDDGTEPEEGDGAAAKGMSGKALYGDDVTSSGFLRLWPQDNQNGSPVSSKPPSVRSSDVPPRSDSPPFTYNQNRETTSSTVSTPVESRISTAATSVASHRSATGPPGKPMASPQPMPGATAGAGHPPLIERQTTKSRRLYGQGLDQHIYDQQSSAMHRLESLQRQRATGATALPRNLSQPGSGTNLQERYQRTGAPPLSNAYRAASPPQSGSPSRLREFDLGLADPGSSTTGGRAEGRYGRSPPLSPPMSPIPDPKLVAALEPNDVGKATAMGAFNKPMMQYDEQQYLARQIQLQQKGDTPSITHPSSPLAPSIDRPTRGSPRGESPVSPLSRSNSSESHPLGDPAVPKRPETHGEDQSESTHPEPAPSEHGESALSADAPSEIGSSPRSEGGAGHHLSRQTSSTNQDPAEWEVENPKPGKPRDMDHPIYRQRHPPDRSNSSEQRMEGPAHLTTVSNTPGDVPVSPGKLESSYGDSPTLRPANKVAGLNGLVHTHLRRNSAQSSVYPEPSPLGSKFPTDVRRDERPFTHEAEGRSSETFFRKSTWEDDGLPVTHGGSGGARQTPVGIPPPLSLRARHVLEQAVALQKYHSPKFQPTQGPEKSTGTVGRGVPRGTPPTASGPSWQDQLKAHHTRGGSTETEKERESFAHELAERRRMVQDNLKSFVESESRSNSPMPAHRALEHSPSKPGTTFGILRAKTSKGTLAGKPEHPSRAMKMLGISIGPGTSSSSLHSRHEGGWEPEDERLAHHGSHDQRAPAHPRTGPQDSHLPKNPLQPPRRAERSNERQQGPFPRTSPPPSKTFREDRSNSDSSDKGFDGPRGPVTAPGPQARESHLGHHPGGAPARTYNNFSRPPVDQGHGASHPTAGERSLTAQSGRLRTDSKANAPGYAEHGANRPYYPSPSDSSPGSTYSGHSTPSHEPSPNASTMTTPFTMASFPTSTRIPSSRKRSINKHDISDPTFISSTSSVITVNLPPGARLRNGMGPSPGPPPNASAPNPLTTSRRRRTQTLRQALGRSEKAEPVSRPPPTSQLDEYEERSTFSADEGEPKARSRTRLRKISSEGGNMSAKARQQAMMAPSPAMPPYLPKNSAGPSPTTRSFPHPVPAHGPVTGGMF